MRSSKQFFAFLLLILCLASVSFSAKKIDDLKPTVILISLDGFRSDYLELYKPKYLNKLAKSGVRAKWMIPSFPTKTFPNHYTIATGLFPDHHGIVANNIYDPDFDAVFGLGKRDEVQNPRWWGGEPIWNTAEKQGQKAAAFFFPGTETPIGGKHIATWNQYDGKVPNEERVDTLLSWFDQSAETRPTSLNLYFSDADDAGHRFSPESKETAESVKRVDAAIKRLLSGLKERGIRNKVNIIVVSDHGMAAVPRSNQIILDEMFDVNDAARIFWVGELIQIFPKDGKEAAIYDSIKAKLPKTASIYRKSELPGRYNYGSNKRVAPILVLPDVGWVLTTRERYDKLSAEGRIETTGGSHGYDNESKEMRALFIAHGPAFRNHYVAEPFKNVEVYNLMCKILNLSPAKNDGDFENVRQLLRANR